MRTFCLICSLKIFSLWQLLFVNMAKANDQSVLFWDAGKLKLKCNVNDFLCMDGTQCINKSFLCDGEPDCLDHSDELICATGPKICTHPEEFQCHNNECIPRNWVSDTGPPDCQDGSDEIDVRTYCESGSDRFLCANKEQCIPGSYLCDSVQQCLDNSDEQNCDIACKNHNCSHTCRPTPTGAICLCPPGFKLLNNTVCLDEDECMREEPRACEHICINTAGSFHCECQDGYQLWTDQRSCVKPRNQTEILEENSVKLIVAGTQGIYSVSVQYLDASMTAGQMSSHMTGSSQLLLPRDVDALAYDPIRNQLIFHDVMETTIKSLYVEETYRKGDAKVKDLYTDVIQLEGLALDPGAQNLYWTTYLGFLFVGKLDGSIPLTLLRKGFDKPRGIALDLQKSYMYLTIWGHSSQILKCHLDGTACITILSVSGHPNFIVIGPVYQSQNENKTGPVKKSPDRNTSIYWTDSKEDLICSLTLGENVVTQIQLNNARNPHPFGLAVTREAIFYTDLNTYSLHGILMSDASSIYDLDLDIGSLYDVFVIEKDQKVSSSSVCQVNNGNCSHFCFPRPGGQYVCQCPLTKPLGVDNKTCEDEASPTTTETVEEMKKHNQEEWQSGHIVLTDDKPAAKERNNSGWSNLWILGIIVVFILVLVTVVWVRRIRKQTVQLPEVLRYHKTDDEQELVPNEALPQFESQTELEFVDCMTGYRPRENSMISADSGFAQGRTDASLGSLVAA